MAETLSTRVTRTEKNLAQAAKTLAAMAQKQAETDGLVKILLDAQIRNEERFRQTDERIEKLVIAIGKLIARRNGGHS
jgi:hypothetical protein